MIRGGEYFKNKKVTVVGLGRSGLAAASLLYDLGAQVSVTDSQDNELTRLNAEQLESRKIKCELGSHSRGFIRSRDLVVVSPGVEDTSPAFVWAEESGTPVIGEIELAWILCSGTVIAVTGSNGKTTVTTLIGRMLEKAGKRVWVCGNIGRPFSGEVARIQAGDFVALEVSSFQLERIISLKPKISVILNFNANHLDRYSDIDEYFQAKKRIFMNQTEGDYLVLNYEDPYLKELSVTSGVKTVYFSGDRDFNPNQAAVLAVGVILGIDRSLTESVFKEFKGLTHRMEYVKEFNSRKFINDSKSTTVDSAIWALRSIPDDIVLIAGGKDKGVDYSRILELARQKLKGVVLLGEARSRIAAVFEGVLPVEEASTLEEAVQKAYRRSRPGEAVLFSPMCSSFDMFKNYEERGERFKQAVVELTASQSKK